MLLFFKKEDLLLFWRRRQRPERVINHAYAAWLKREPPASAWRVRVAKAGKLPRISVVMPVHDPNPVWLRDAIASVKSQIFPDWELIIADDASTDPAVATVLAECVADPRIHVVRLEKQGGISAATNAALTRTDGEFVAFLDHDDKLAPHALAAVAIALAEDPRLDLVFSDEDQIVGGRRAAPYFKPGWNQDLFLSQNLVCHLAVYRRELLARLGGLRGEVVGAQDYDLALRVVDEIGAHRVRHLPLVLYHWRQSEGSFSASRAAACQEAARQAVAWHLHGQASVGTAPELPQWPDVRFNLPDPAPSVSIVGADVPAGTVYNEALLNVVTDAAQATGDVLVFLSPALRPDGEGWLHALVAQASRPEIGAAGALLLGPNGRWLHTGYELHPKLIAHSAAPNSDAADPGYRGQFALPRSVAAVSLDCLAVRRDVFVAAGGLTQAARDFAGVDLCLRLAARGLRTVWTPHARLHYTRRPSPPSTGAAWMRQRWAKTLADDPYRNPNLKLAGGRLSLA